MRMTKSFTMPEEDPVVPERLAERITDLLPHTTKIDIKESTRGGWRVFNTLYLEGGEEASEVYTMIKAAADRRAMEVGHAGKYRAQVWRLPPGRTEHERHTVTFHVHDEYDDEEPPAEEHERREQGTGWRDLVEGYQRFAEFIAQYNQRATDRVLEQSRQDAERLNPMADVIHDFASMYREGLRMKSDAVREIHDLRLRQQLSEAQSKDSDKFWEVFGPAVQVATVQVGQHFIGGGGKPKPRALPPATAPAARRTREVSTKAVSPTPPSSPPAEPPRSEPSRPEPPERTTPTAQPDAQAPGASEPATMPASLHELAAALLDSLGAQTLVRLGRVLDEEPMGYLEAIAAADDDDCSAEAIVALMQSLMTNAAAVTALQAALSPDQIGALRQVAVLAQRHLSERDAQDRQGAPPVGDAPSPGRDGVGP